MGMKELLIVVGGGTVLGAIIPFMLIKHESVPRTPIYVVEQTKSGKYEGHPVQLTIDYHGERSFVMWENDLSNRGYHPATLISKDLDSKKPGFEHIELKNAVDVSDDSVQNRENPLKKYASPDLCERIFDHTAGGGIFYSRAVPKEGQEFDFSSDKLSVK